LGSIGSGSDSLGPCADHNWRKSCFYYTSMNISQRSRWPGERGFTLVETMIGLMILVVAASSIFFALSQLNRAASVARLYTSAQFIVQSNINTIQSDSPFVPQNSQIPSELALGTTSTTGVPIYVDPATGLTMASGTMTSTVTNISNTTLNEYAYVATIRLSYTYRSTNYQVVESTVRGSDQ
jgi:prepilin-type N-terminal cleavage/methylation domain-containing protein